MTIVNTNYFLRYSGREDKSVNQSSQVELFFFCKTLQSLSPSNCACTSMMSPSYGCAPRQKNATPARYLNLDALIHPCVRSTIIKYYVHS